jgi:proline-specific peptidase
LAKEGFLEFRGHRLWYCVVEPDRQQPGKLPLLCLHGGPGIPHDYLEPLEALAKPDEIESLASGGRRVIFYDQLGCGNSEKATDLSIYSIEYFKDELAFVRTALGLDRIHLLGQSWGGCLALEHVLSQAAGVCGLILANTPASIRQFVTEAYRLMDELPGEVRQTIQQYEASGTTEDPEYKLAMQVFNHNYFCRLDPWPECLQRAYEKAGQDFRGAGKIIDWNVTDRLCEIQVPTLLLSGRYDEVTPACVETVHSGISGSEWVLFENSSHMPHLEETGRFLQVLSEFLHRVEAPLAG